jgi:hypothetical protein
MVWSDWVNTMSVPLSVPDQVEGTTTLFEFA